jgi:hypothetical protein
VTGQQGRAGKVVIMDRITPYQEIARLLTEHRISGVPHSGLDEFDEAHDVFARRRKGAKGSADLPREA